MNASNIQIDLDISPFTSRQLLALHAKISDLLRGRGVTRSSNNPVGDLAEHLFCKAFGWTPQTNSNAHVDAVGKDGSRYQIKGRRVKPQDKSRELSAIRDLEGVHFDYLAGVIFSEDYTILRAAIIPHATVKARVSSFVERTKSYKFLLREDVWDENGVQDVTDQLRKVDIG